MQNLFIKGNKFETPLFIVVCLILLQYWSPQFKNKSMTTTLATILGSSIMASVLVFYLTDLDLGEAVMFGLGYFIVVWLLRNYTNVISKEKFNTDQSKNNTVTLTLSKGNPLTITGKTQVINGKNTMVITQELIYIGRTTKLRENITYLL